MVPHHRRKSGHITCYLNRTYHVLLTILARHLHGGVAATFLNQRRGRGFGLKLAPVRFDPKSRDHWVIKHVFIDTVQTFFKFLKRLTRMRVEFGRNVDLGVKAVRPALRGKWTGQQTTQHNNHNSKYPRASRGVIPPLKVSGIHGS
jgi:hypothetical protein